MTDTLLAAIGEKILLSDGAMGTQLQLAGLEPGECGEHWNLTRPKQVERIQRAYAAAGSDILITNTFGACRLALERNGLADEVREINHAAVEIARRAMGDKPGFILGDIGPFGGLMSPFGETPEADVRSAFSEQAEALVSAGVDGIIVETQTAFEEAGLGIEAAQKAGSPCVIVSFSFDVSHDGADLFTMMGINPEAAAEFARSAGADIIGINCGGNVDIDWAITATKRYRKTCNLPVMAQPNAGMPELVDFKTVYRQTPEEMASKVVQLAEAGANIIGSCCGSTPETIAAMRRNLSGE
jgi:5-methyltetrahydrofolate--homocysteine methyltransferase